MDQKSENTPDVQTSESNNGDGDKQILAPAEGPREHLISTAVKFLQNPKVMSSPLYQKRSFLEKKGLTQEEINLAVERSGVKETAVSDMQLAPQPPPPGFQPNVMGPHPNAIVPAYAPIHPQSTWGRIRDLTMTSVIVVGVSYGFYNLFHRYLRPLILGKTQQEQRLDRIEAQIMDIQKSVAESLAELNKTMAGIQVSLQNNQIESTAKINDQHSRDLTDLKTDIASLKGLLLNKNQFPPAPTVPPVSLALPAWQRAQPSSTKTVASPSSASGESTSATSLTTGGVSTISEEVNASKSQISEIPNASLTSTSDNRHTDSNDETNQHSSLAESDSV